MAVDRATETLHAAGRDTTLWAVYPPADPDDVPRADWVRFHEHLDFGCERPTGPDGGPSFLRRDDFAPAPPAGEPRADRASASIANHHGNGSWA